MEEVRQRVVGYLERANLNDFIKETLNNAFEDSTGNRNVLERDPKSQKEQSRPSKAMFNTKGAAPKPKQRRNTNPRNGKQRKQSTKQQQRGRGQQQRGSGGGAGGAAGGGAGGAGPSTHGQGSGYGQ